MIAWEILAFINKMKNVSVKDVVFSTTRCEESFHRFVTAEFLVESQEISRMNG